MKRIRNYFISGLVFWVPLGISITVIKFFLELINNIIPKQYLPESLFNFNTAIPGSGILWVILIIIITGVLVSNLIGRKLVNLWERFLNKIPGFRGIYNAFKEISVTVLSSSSKSFRKTLLVEYPRRDMWTIAFQTGNYNEEVIDIIGEESINIYVPTTPNPTSGFFIIVPKKDIIVLDISVDEAFKLIISTGTIKPNKKFLNKS